jgi:hypothetical protein
MGLNSLHFMHGASLSGYGLKFVQCGGCYLHIFMRYESSPAGAACNTPFSIGGEACALPAVMPPLPVTS